MADARIRPSPAGGSARGGDAERNGDTSAAAGGMERLKHRVHLRGGWGMEWPKHRVVLKLRKPATLRRMHGVTHGRGPNRAVSISGFCSRRIQGKQMAMARTRSSPASGSAHGGCAESNRTISATQPRLEPDRVQQQEFHGHGSNEAVSRAGSARGGRTECNGTIFLTQPRLEPDRLQQQVLAGWLDFLADQVELINLIALADFTDQTQRPDSHISSPLHAGMSSATGSRPMYIYIYIYMYRLE